MGDGATLLLVEAILPELARDSPATIRMDLHMLMLLHGRERTAAEYERLLSRAGRSMNRVVATASPVGLGIVEAVPSTQSPQANLPAPAAQPVCTNPRATP